MHLQHVHAHSYSCSYVLFHPRSYSYSWHYACHPYPTDYRTPALHLHTITNSQTSLITDLSLSAQHFQLRDPFSIHTGKPVGVVGGGWGRERERERERERGRGGERERERDMLNKRHTSSQQSLAPRTPTFVQPLVGLLVLRPKLVLGDTALICSFFRLCQISLTVVRGCKPKLFVC